MTSITRSPAHCVFALIIVTALLAVRGISSRDPGSWFFDPSAAYNLIYTAHRQRQAERFIALASDVAPFRSRNTTASLCLGIPSVARDDGRYLHITIGSLLAGLTTEERDAMHVKVLIAHTTPEVHPAYHEVWLPNVVDEILLYNLSKAEYAHVAELEHQKGLYREKGLFDYRYLLSACRTTEASYIAMIEDDVVALDGWYHRTMNGLRQAEQRSKPAYGEGRDNFLYLRLFYTEQFLGWNAEEWPIHTFWSIVSISMTAVAVFGVRQLFPSSKGVLTPGLSVSICAIVVPLLIILTFAAGKTTVFPLKSGIVRMDNYGCCAQGLVYPSHKADELIQWYDNSRVGFADMLTEEYADAHKEQRWSLTPSVLQHVGARSSKTDDFVPDNGHSRHTSRHIWNFGFELNKAQVLEQEHALAVLQGS